MALSPYLRASTLGTGAITLWVPCLSAWVSPASAGSACLCWADDGVVFEFLPVPSPVLFVWELRYPISNEPKGKKLHEQSLHPPPSALCLAC